MALTFETIQRLLERYNTFTNYGDLDCVGRYGEPGYTDPKELILFANWNNIPRYICEGLERRGYALEWKDEWIIDYDNDKAYRCVADSYYWTPSYFMNQNGTIWGKDEWSGDDRIEYFKNNTDEFEPFDLDLEPYGWYEFECEDTEIFGDYARRDKLVEHMNDHGLDVIFQNYSGGYIRIWLKSQTEEYEDGQDH